MSRHLAPLSAAIVLALSASAAHAALVTGDIAFTSFNADEDGFSFAALTDIGAGTVIHFNDNEWNGSAIGSGGAFNTGEGMMSWNSGASLIGAGTVIRISAFDSGSSATASVGSMFGASGDNGINATNETIYAFLGGSATTPTTFLAAISNGGFGSNGTLTNTGLASGTNAIALTASTDFAEYVGTRSGQATFGAYRSLLSSNGNWNNLGDGNFDGNVPNTTAFAVTPVPLPAAAWLLLTGMGGMFGFARRKRAA